MQFCANGQLNDKEAGFHNVQLNAQRLDSDPLKILVDAYGSEQKNYIIPEFYAVRLSIEKQERRVKQTAYCSHIPKRMMQAAMYELNLTIQEKFSLMISSVQDLFMKKTSF